METWRSPVLQPSGSKSRCESSNRDLGRFDQSDAYATSLATGAVGAVPVGGGGFWGETFEDSVGEA